MKDNNFSCKCVVKGCTNTSDAGTFVGSICAPCYVFITRGEGRYSQAYKNALKVSYCINKPEIRRIICQLP